MCGKNQDVLQSQENTRLSTSSLASFSSVAQVL